MDTLENPVHDAARRGNLDFLKECLENGVSPTGLDASGNSPIHWYLSLIIFKLTNKTGKLLQGRYLKSHRSARGGHLDCFQELLRSASKQFGSTTQFINVQVRY